MWLIKAFVGNYESLCYCLYCKRERERERILYCALLHFRGLSNKTLPQNKGISLAVGLLLEYRYVSERVCVRASVCMKMCIFLLLLVALFSCSSFNILPVLAAATTAVVIVVAIRFCYFSFVAFIHSSLSACVRVCVT